MAEGEKRRSTTFRTSKGTIVNVTYPDIYVSPAFLSTEDVTNPTEMREALKEQVTRATLNELVETKWNVKCYGTVTPALYGSNPCCLRDGDYYRLYRSSTPLGGEPGYGIAVRNSPDGITAFAAETLALSLAAVQAVYPTITFVGQPCVVKDGGIYYLFFKATGLGVCVATSTDGATFTNSTLVLANNAPMENDIGHPWVFQFRSKWYMIYIGGDTRTVSYKRDKLFKAESDSLTTGWTRTGVVALDGHLGDWDGGDLLDHSVTVVDDVLIIAYAAMSLHAAADMRIGLAFSLDGKIWHYSKHNPVLTRDVLVTEALYIGDNSIIWEGGKLKMWHEANDGGANPAVRIFYVELSPDELDVRELYLNREIRDAADHYTDFLKKTTDKLSIIVENNHDQIATVQVEGSRFPDFSELFNVGASFTVAIASNDYATLSDPSIFYRAKITYAIAPASGNITIVAVGQ